MKLDRLAPILALGLCSGPDKPPPATHHETIIPDTSLRQALDKIHLESSGPHCPFTAEALENARFVQLPDGIKIQMGSRVFRVLRWSRAETAVLQSIPTKERPDTKCLEVDGIPDNDVGWYDCGESR